MQQRTPTAIHRLTVHVAAVIRRVVPGPSTDHSTTTHAAWNDPLHPAAWEGLPPKPWQSQSVPFTQKSEPAAASTRPAVRFPMANVA